MSENKSLWWVVNPELARSFLENSEDFFKGITIQRNGTQLTITTTDEANAECIESILMLYSTGKLVEDMASE